MLTIVIDWVDDDTAADGTASDDALSCCCWWCAELMRLDDRIGCGI